MLASIFWDFTLPNSSTWFYFSLVLAVALFYQFTRLVTLRNFDLLALFLFVPGFLFIQDANAIAGRHGDDRPARYAGYGWLLGASLVWFIRCLVDFAVPRRPLVSPNLTPAGLVWFAGVLFVGLLAVAFGRSDNPWQPVGRQSAAIKGIQTGAAAALTQAQGDPDDDGRDAAFWVERALAATAHAAVAAGLFLVGYRLFQDLSTGLAAGALYLLLPYTAYHVGQAHHVWPAACAIWAVYLYRRPGWAGVLIGLAAGTTFFSILLVPAWARFYHKRGSDRFLTGFALAWMAGFAVTILVLRLAGRFPDGMSDALHLADWQPWRVPSAESIWTGVYWAYRVPVFAVYAIFIVSNFIWYPARNLGQLIAISAAILIGVQFWFADRGGLYVLWFVPLLILLVLRPSLADLMPAEPRPLPALLNRVGRWLNLRTATRQAVPANEELT